jgi:hypothetical protein
MAKRIGNTIPGTYDIAHAAGWDAGNKSAGKAGRKVWNDEDHAAALAEFHRVYNEEDEREWQLKQQEGQG